MSLRSGLVLAVALAGAFGGAGASAQAVAAAGDVVWAPPGAPVAIVSADRFAVDGEPMTYQELLTLAEAGRKNTGVAVALSVLVPGTGHMYLGQWLVGSLNMLVNMLIGSSAIYTGEPLYYASWVAWDLYVIFDAYMETQRYNRSLAPPPAGPAS